MDWIAFQTIMEPWFIAVLTGGLHAAHHQHSTTSNGKAVGFILVPYRSQLQRLLLENCNRENLKPAFLVQGAGAESLAPTAIKVFRGTFISHVMVYMAIMTKLPQGLSWERFYNISDGPMERLCADLLPLMGSLTALNLLIPRVPRLPAFHELEHLELHSSKIPWLRQRSILLSLAIAALSGAEIGLNIN